MPPKLIIGKCLLRSHLNRLHMTQAELAKRTGIDYSQINKYVHNERIITLNNAKLIAKVLRCRIEDLYEWKI